MTGFMGLDLGTSRIVLASHDDGRANTSEQLNAFVALPNKKMTVSMLEHEKILHFVADGQVYAFGNRAEEFASIVGGSTRRPMQTGLLNADEPRSLEITEMLLNTLCGKARKGHKLCYSIPASPHEDERRLIFHREEAGRMLGELGYEVTNVNEGLAVVYADLKDCQFTGIGVSFGGGTCNICVAFRGLSVIEFATPRAGDFIDNSAAIATGETPITVRKHKENGYKIGARSNALDRAISIYYQAVIDEVADAIEKQLSSSKRLPTFAEPVRVVCAGGTAAANGFVPAFKKALALRDLPVQIGEVSLSSDPLNATANGALVSAMVNM